MALSLGEWGVNVKQDKNDYRRKLPFDKPWTLYIFVRVLRGGGGGGATRTLITEIKKQVIAE